MAYKSLWEAVFELEKKGELIRLSAELDPDLEIPAIHRRVCEAGGPAILYERVKGSPFPAVSNLFGTIERARFLFRDTLPAVKAFARLRAEPVDLLKRPYLLFSILKTSLRLPPIPGKNGPVLASNCRISDLPALRSWPEDGGPFILLPQVLSEDPEKPGIFSTNLGMYRAQLSGNDYIKDKEIGLHYQLRRDIGIHHSKALLMGKRLPVSIFIGGPPAHSLAAVMPLPEGLSELLFAGALGGRNFRYTRIKDHIISLDADFCITGYIAGDMKKEGPFGDHLGYYSLEHDFPYLEDIKVYHRRNPLWPFTVVGRPPAEDSIFGQLIHEITEPLVPFSLPGVFKLHAVDLAGVHPLLLAIGEERFGPGIKGELLREAMSILGFGHCSLAKYLFIVAKEGSYPDIYKIREFFSYLLERVDFENDLHFQTRTTMDTLDYTGYGLNKGSKLIIAASGPPRRRLGKKLPSSINLPESLKGVNLLMPGVLAFSGQAAGENPEKSIEPLIRYLSDNMDLFKDFPLILFVDDHDFVAKKEANWLWVAFTRSDPARDVYGVKSFIKDKHWGCKGPMVIDARIKAHHAPLLEEDPEIEKRVLELAASGGPLHGIF